jgi:serine/threonine protein kinase
VAFQKSQPAYQSLRAILAEKTTPVIAWVGAGLSAPAGLPSWKGLIEGLIDAGKQKIQNINDTATKGLLQNAQEKYKIGDYWTGFQLLEQVLGGTTYQSEIRQRLGAGSAAPIPQTYTLLWKVGISGLVNLNLDPLAARAYSTVFPGVDVERFSGHQARNLMGVLQRNKRFIANVHGTLEDATTWVFTHSKLKPLLADNGYRQFVSTCLTARTILFVGLTADDIAVRDHFERLGAAGVSGIEHFWITDRNDASTDAWAEGLNIRVIRYVSVDHDHRELTECLTDLTAAQPGKYPDLTPIAFSGSKVGGVLPAPDELATLPLEQVRTQLNARALEILKDQDSDAYTAYARFAEEYDEAIDRAWYVTLTPPKNVLLGYTLTRRVNSGAFGVVYEAIAPDGEKVALKLLRRDVRTDSTMLQTFRRGVRSMKILQSHAVKGMVGFRDASEIPALVVMEWIEGPDLDELVKSKSIGDWHTIIRISRDLSHVIFRAHKLTERVLHRDIRPPNVMIRDFWSGNDDYEVVVTDFDLSWHIDSLEHSIVAKPLGFMAPEQLRRRDTKESTQTRSALVDSFGFAMTLFYVLTSEVPVPDQQKHSDWDNTLRTKVASKSFPQWKSLPTRVARLIRGSTKDQQSERWDFSRIVGELDLLWAIVNGDYKDITVDLVAEETAAQTESVLQYRWDDDKSAAIYETPGFKIELAGNLPTRTVQLTMQWQQTGADNWKNRFKSAADVRSRIDGILENGGWTSVKNDGSIGFTRVSALGTPEVTPESIRKLAKSIDAVANALRARG